MCHKRGRSFLEVKNGHRSSHSEVARQGIARTFQNIALFEGMSVLDNVMTGRLTQMNSGFISQAFIGEEKQSEKK